MLALDRFVPRKLLAWRFASFKSAPTNSVPEKSSSDKSQPESLAPVSRPRNGYATASPSPSFAKMTLIAIFLADSKCSSSFSLISSHNTSKTGALYSYSSFAILSSAYTAPTIIAEFLLSRSFTADSNLATACPLCAKATLSSIAVARLLVSQITAAPPTTYVKNLPTSPQNRYTSTKIGIAAIRRTENLRSSHPAIVSRIRNNAIHP